MCLKYSSTDRKAHNDIVAEVLKNRSKLNLDESFGMNRFSKIQGGMYVARGNHGILSLSRALLWLYHCLYINRFYRDDLLKQGSI